MPHTAGELACGLVSPVALIAGLIILRRALLRRISWELGLLVIALILCMLPTAGVFRWSFRWLPLVHLVLALCAAESLQLFFVARVFRTRLDASVCDIRSPARNLPLDTA